MPKLRCPIRVKCIPSLKDNTKKEMYLILYYPTVKMITFFMYWLKSNIINITNFLLLLNMDNYKILDGSHYVSIELWWPKI